MTRTLATLFGLVLLTQVAAATECTSRKSGSVTVTTCSYKTGFNKHCRSYRSGSVRKTSCRS